MSPSQKGPTADNPWQRLLRALRIDQSPSARPKPWVKVDLGPHLPGWAYRLLLGMIALGCGLLAFDGVITWVIGGLMIAVIMFRPGGMAPATLVIILAIALLASGGSPFDARALLLLFGTHLLVVLAAQHGDLSPFGLLELKVLAGPLRRFAVIQASAQVVGLAVGWLSGRQLSSPGLGIIGGIALAVLAALLLGRLARALREG